MRQVGENFYEIFERDRADLQTLCSVLTIYFRISVLGSIFETLVRMRQPVVYPFVFGRVELGFVDGDRGEREKEQRQHDKPVELLTTVSGTVHHSNEHGLTLP